MVKTLGPFQANGQKTPLRLAVRDVTGTHTAELDLDPELRVGEVAETLAERLSLPRDTAWALRDEVTAGFLDDDASIGEAVERDGDTRTSLVLTAKAHLGGGAAPA